MLGSVLALVLQNEADRTLIYVTLYISECLKKLQKVRKVNFCAGGTLSVLGIVLGKGFADILLPVAQITLFTPVLVVRATDTPRLWISKETLCCYS